MSVSYERFCFHSDFLFKLVLVGDTGVGKSCILLRFADDAFTESFITTIGVDFRFRTIAVDDKNVKLQIGTFENVNDWLMEVNHYASESTCKILVGNKCDLTERKKVSTEAGQRKAAELGIDFIETSAKDATNVENVFVMIAQRLIAKRGEQLAQQAQSNVGGEKTLKKITVKEGARAASGAIKRTGQGYEVESQQSVAGGIGWARPFVDDLIWEAVEWHYDKSMAPIAQESIKKYGSKLYELFRLQEQQQLGQSAVRPSPYLPPPGM